MHGMRVKLLLWFWVTIIEESSQVLMISYNETSDGITTLVLGSLQLTLSSKLLLDVYSPRGNILKGYQGWIPSRSNITYTPCPDSSEESICLKYGKITELLITQDQETQCEEDTMSCHAVSCYKVLWKDHVGGIMDCFLLGDDHWYGGNQALSQRWPIQSDSSPWHPAVTGDPLHHPSGNVVENLWFSSGGFSIYVDHETPLFVNFNESGSGKFCFTTSSKKYPYHNIIRDQKLSYSICAAASVKDVYSYSAHRWLKKPTSIPDEDIFEYPIWSTWVKFRRNIDQAKVIDFAKSIKSASFPGSQIEIDDKWENCYGELEFDSTKFPNPKDMISELRDLGFRTTLWVHPFSNVDCKTFEIGEKKGFWVKNKNGNTLQVKWWNGIAAVLDTTQKSATEWFTSRLKQLQSSYGIESFKFDAGEVFWLDDDFVLHEEEANLQPNIFSRSYAELAASFGGRIEVRVGYKSQQLPIFVREFDKFSHWDYANGLQTLIPCSLQLSILGYFFILPDMIGGNNYDSANGSLPDRELYIRWLEANVFLPAIQFSIAPWDYDEEVIKIARKMINLRETYAGYMMNLARKTTTSGEPLIRPLWWIAPDDDEAQSTDSQFLVGDGLLVAPVLNKGMTSRDIYLPEGKWADVQRGRAYEGAQWLYDYSSPLNYLPFFVRQS